MSISIRKAKAGEEEVETHTQIQRSGFPILLSFLLISNKDMDEVETNWSRDGPRLKSDNVRRGCRLQDRSAVQGRSGS